MTTTPCIDLTKDDAAGKHPLECSWVLWYQGRASSTTKWEETLQAIAVFNTVEDFWSTYNHIKRPSEIDGNGDYYLFKDGVKPVWEDERNKAGGTWVANSENKTMDDQWEGLLLALIGEALEDDDDDMICGGRLQKRGRGVKIMLWTNTCEKKDALTKVGTRLKQCLQVNTAVEFNRHNEKTILVAV